MLLPCVIAVTLLLRFTGNLNSIPPPSLQTPDTKLADNLNYSPFNNISFDSRSTEDASDLSRLEFGSDTVSTPGDLELHSITVRFYPRYYLHEMSSNRVAMCINNVIIVVVAPFARLNDKLCRTLPYRMHSELVHSNIATLHFNLAVGDTCSYLPQCKYPTCGLLPKHHYLRMPPFCGDNAHVCRVCML